MIKINNLSITFNRYEDDFFKKNNLAVINNLDFYAEKGKISTIIGASGSGKSLLANAILGILPKNANLKGDILYNDKIINDQEKKKLRGKKIALIPQSVNFLNPLKTIGQHIMRSCIINGYKKKQARKKIFELLEIYKLDKKVKDLYPHEISGGMARRVLTALAAVTEAELIIADEPTTGLDSKLIDESLILIKKIADSGKTVILITHDINCAINYSDNITVFYSGTTVECSAGFNFKNPDNLLHPYSKDLINALPENNFEYLRSKDESHSINNTGCVYEPYCPIKRSNCSYKIPDLKRTNNGFVRCDYV